MSESKYEGRLFPVTVGQVISVVGKASNDCSEFTMNLKSERGPEVDIIFQIAAKFQDGVIVRNSKIASEWGQEEVNENVFNHNSLNPLTPGGNFKIDIFVDHDAFFVSINGKPFCTYNHRQGLDTIQFLSICNDVEAVYQVNQTNEQERPWPAPNVNVFEATAPAQFNPGNVVVITGVPKGNQYGDFLVEFYDGSNKFRRHFQLRAFLEHQSMTLNSQDESEEWRSEVSSGHPFNICEAFKMAIAMTNNSFEIAANGSRIASLEYGDHNDRLFGSLTGISIISKNGLCLEVQGVDYMKLDESADGFESFTQI